jgi:hypothetical protein
MIPKHGWMTKRAIASERKFAPGEYVSIHDDAGELHTFQVTFVQPAS